MKLDDAIREATAHFSAGRHADAERLCRSVLQVDPNRGDVFHLLGLIAFQTGRPEAEAFLRRAINLRPTDTVAYNNLAFVLQSRGDLDHALESRRQALALQPHSAEAHFLLGHVFHIRGELDHAVACYRRAIAINQKYVAAYLNLGAAQEALGSASDAIAIYRRALAIDPDYADALSNLANVLWLQGELDEAEIHSRRALALRPDYPEALLNMGNILVARREFPEAIRFYRRAIACRADYADAHSNLAMALLTIGEFEEGWKEHEWRWSKPSFPSPPRPFKQPRWDGTPLAGRTLLVHAEQGLGDTLQFSRFLIPLARRGGRVVFEAPASLLPLLRASPWLEAAEWIEQDPRGGLPPTEFDLHAPLMSLPLLLGLLDPGKTPPPVPYLSAPEGRDLPPPLTNAPSGILKVGLVWSGGEYPRDRSIPLQLLSSLARPGVQLFTLQLGEASNEVSRAAEIKLIDLSPEIGNFSDTALLLSGLDLLISVDTAAAHLAGAMGLPVWILLKYSPDFRWQLERSDTPWYPTAKLFRQSNRADWTPVVDSVAKELEQAVARRLGGRVPARN